MINQKLKKGSRKNATGFFGFKIVNQQSKNQKQVKTKSPKPKATPKPKASPKKHAQNKVLNPKTSRCINKPVAKKQILRLRKN